jgi:putative PIN family toxin of toxin-antitoxin system
MRIVLDTNIVVSSYIVPVGAPARIMAAWRGEAFVLVVSTWVLAEYEHSLNYPRVRRRHGLTAEEIAQHVADIRELATLVEPTSVSLPDASCRAPLQAPRSGRWRNRAERILQPTMVATGW